MAEKTKKEFDKKARVASSGVTVNEWGEEIVEISNHDPKHSKARRPSKEFKPAAKEKKDPPDDATAQNRKYFSEQLDFLETYKASMMQAYGLYVTLPVDIDFRAGEEHNQNDLYPSVILGKLITGTEAVTHKDKDGKEVQIIVNHFDHLRINYHERAEENRTTQTFTVANFTTDHNLSRHDETNAKRAIVEMVKSAYLLAEHAKANNWAEVNFGRTTDPVKRYILAKACKDLGLNCSSERVDASALPKVPSLEGVGLDMHLRAYAKMFRENIYLPVVAQTEQTRKTAPRTNPQPIAA